MGGVGPRVHRTRAASRRGSRLPRSRVVRYVYLPPFFNARHHHHHGVEARGRPRSAPIAGAGGRGARPVGRHRRPGDGTRAERWTSRGRSRDSAAPEARRRPRRDAGLSNIASTYHQVRPTLRGHRLSTVARQVVDNSRSAWRANPSHGGGSQRRVRRRRLSRRRSARGRRRSRGAARRCPADSRVILSQAWSTVEWSRLPSSAPMRRSETSVSSRIRNIAIWRGTTIALSRFWPLSCVERRRRSTRTRPWRSARA